MFSFDSVPLTPLDQTLPLTTAVSFLLFFHPEDINSALQILRSGWERSVRQLPLLAGNVVNQSGDGQKRGIRYLVPSYRSLSVDDLVETRYHSLPLSAVNGREVEDQLVASLSSSEGQAVSRVVLNVMKDGIVFCLTWSHTIFDGNGASLLVEMLADTCRGKASRLPPSYGTEINLRKMIASLERPAKMCPQEFSDLFTNGEKENSDLPMAEKRLITHSFHVSPARLHLLRDSCNTFLRQWTSLNQKEKTPPFLTKNDVLTSAVSVCVTRSRNKGTRAAIASKKIHFGMAVDVRRQLNLLLEDGQQYLGNTFITIAVHADIPSTQENAKGQDSFIKGMKMTDFYLTTYIASQVRKKLLTIDRSHVSSLVSYIRDNSADRQMVFETWDLAFSSVRHLPLHSLEFGEALGRVRDFKDYKSDSDGSVYVLAKRPYPGPRDEEEQMQLLLTLDEEDMNIFLEDPLIIWLQGHSCNSRV